VAHIRVLNHYLHSKFILLGLIEFIVLTYAVQAGGFLRAYYYGEENQLFALNLQMICFATVMCVCSISMGVYTAVFHEGKTGMMLRTIVSYCFLGTASLSILYYFVPPLYLGQGVLSFAVVVSLLAIFLVRICFYELVDLAQLRQKVVVLGAGENAQYLVDCIDKIEGKRSFWIEGCVPCNGDKVVVADQRLINSPSDWNRFCQEQKVNELVIAPDERRRSEGGTFPVDALLNCKLAGVRVTQAVEFIEREVQRLEISMLSAGWALFANGYKHSWLRDKLKRVSDLVLALILLLLAWPFMLLTVLAVVLETGFPALYKQTRVGFNGKQFSIYKFRSMTKNAEVGGAAVWAQKNDARVTKVGAFIRNARLDELPQLWNVIRGDMSFIGPRPERPEFVNDLNEQIPFYNQRHKVKPGLMGWAQLNYPYGASVDDARNKLKYDLYYVKNHSVFLDVLIFIRTVEVVLLGKGVH
jgi:sugar transferase (PEP-CTERM system associated)